MITLFRRPTTAPRGQRRVTLALLTALTLNFAPLASPAHAATTPVVFDQPGTYEWIVPTGVTRVRLEVYGAQGGNAPGGAKGGKGGSAAATFAVGEGWPLYIAVGGKGGDGTTGTLGGGGGAGGFYGGASGGHSALGAGGGGGGGGATQATFTRSFNHHLSEI